FHSSFMTKVNEIAEKYGVDKRELVINVSLKDRMSPSEKLIKEEARKIKEKKKSGLKKAFVIKRIHADFVDTVSPQKTTLRNVIKQISSVSRKTGKLGVLNIASSQERKNKGLWVSPFIQDSFSYIVGTAEVSDIAHMRKIAHEADGVIDYILFDTTYEIKIKGSPLNVMRKYLKETEVILYNDYRAWINTVAREICQLSGNPSGLKIAVFGDLTYTLNTALILSEAGSSVTLHVDEKEIFKEGALKPFLRKGMKLSLQTDALIASRKKNILVGFSPGRCCITRYMAKEMRNNGIIIDAGLGSIHKDVISYAHRKNIKVIRVDMRPIIAGEITSSLGVKQLVGSHIGRKKIGGKTVVSGGFIGRKGDIVVESVKSPTKVIGIARGDGSVEYRNFGRHKKDIEKIENEILRAKVTLKD
ncbi:MAG: hypothetical protein HQ579_03235, partial [Candidatus Omnitrophica bacterium]|nr:hypothetical protein [Candidatus Omnitrophota bacterium]